MQKFLVTSAAAAFLFFLPAHMWGQAPIEREAPASRTSNLTLEQHHVIKEIIKDSKVKNAPADIQVVVGDTVPQSIPLHLMPAEVGAKFHRSRPTCSSSKARESSLSTPRTTRSST
jgi:hypothetical protein